MNITRFIREKAVEQITSPRSRREEFESSVSYASEEFGGISFVGAALYGRARGVEQRGGHGMPPLRIARSFCRVVEFIFLSTFSEHLAARRWK